MTRRAQTGGIGARLVLWLLLLLSGALLLPVLAYLGAQRLAGPYEGRYGLAQYLGSIYGAAGQGEPLALLLLTAPVLIALVWLLTWPARRPGPEDGEPEADPVRPGKSPTGSYREKKTPYISDS